MHQSFETTFISETINKKLFEDRLAQEFFKMWCVMHDSIYTRFITREEWEKRSPRNILEKHDNGMYVLYIPRDIRLPEAIDIVRAIDHDTFAHDPSQRDKHADKIIEMGALFEKAGRYLWEYVPILDEKSGKNIAETLAQKFYSYGLALQNKQETKEHGSLQDRNTPLTEEEKELLDKWFLGENVYHNRIARLGNHPTKEQKDTLRKKLLASYFSTLAKSGAEDNGDHPWKVHTGPIQHIHDHSKEQIVKAIETPEREMRLAIFRRGMEKLVKNMKDARKNGNAAVKKVLNNFFKEQGYDISAHQRRLYDTLHIDRLKEELDTVRKNGDKIAIANKEYTIARKIHAAVNNIRKKEGIYAPSDTLRTQSLNCVSASILGGGLLDKIGIKYWHVDMHDHVATVLVTSDDKIYWQDFTLTDTKRGNYKEICPEMLDDPQHFPNVKYIPDSGVTLRFKNWNPYDFLEGKMRVMLLPPEIGQPFHVLYNAGISLYKIGEYEKALEALEQARALGPKIADLYGTIGAVLIKLGRSDEAIKECRRAIALDDKDPGLYINMATALFHAERYRESVEIYKKAIAIDHNNAQAHDGLGSALFMLERYEEAVIAFKQALALKSVTSTYFKLGATLEKCNRLKEAIDAFEKCLAKCDDRTFTSAAQKHIEKIKEKLS